MSTKAVLSFQSECAPQPHFNPLGENHWLFFRKGPPLLVRMRPARLHPSPWQPRHDPAEAFAISGIIISRSLKWRVLMR